MAVRVQTEDFDVGAESHALQGPAVGAIALFVGTVRSLSEDDDVTAMTLEHYPGMTEQEITRIETEARDRWPLIDVTIIHRIGRLVAGEQIVLEGVGLFGRCAFDVRRRQLHLVAQRDFRQRRRGGGADLRRADPGLGETSMVRYP